MTSTMFRPRVDNWQGLLNIIKNEEEFSTRGDTFTGKHYDPDCAVLPGKGWMSHENYGRLEVHHKMHGINYIVKSYNTVIAYRTTHGSWHFPTQSYSRTTTRHQGLIMTVAGVLEKSA